MLVRLPSNIGGHQRIEARLQQLSLTGRGRSPALRRATQQALHRQRGDFPHDLAQHLHLVHLAVAMQSEIAAGRDFFNQDPKIIRFVMQNPSDRVTYGDLRMIRTEFDELMQLSMDAGTIKHPIPYEKYVDEQFARNARPAAIPL